MHFFLVYVFSENSIVRTMELKKNWRIIKKSQKVHKLFATNEKLNKSIVGLCKLTYQVHEHMNIQSTIILQGTYM